MAIGPRAWCPGPVRTGWTEERIRSHDGTELAVQVAGDGPLVVLANGLGGSLGAWRPFLQRFGARRRIASWDYRGLYRSGPPPQRDAVTVEDHAGDLATVLRWLGGGPAVLVGWSMGVQVVVAHALRHPSDVRALVLVAGAPGDPLAGVFHTTASRWLVPPATRAVEVAALPFGVLMRAVTAAPRPATRALRSLGVVARGTDLDVFADLAHDFGRLDWRTYMRTIRAMGRHDAWAGLGDLRAPTLVVGGTADLFLPVATLEAMAAAIPGAELRLLPGGTHYLPVEQPVEMAAAVDDFLTRRAPSPGA